MAAAQDLPFETSTLFSGSGNCAVCHTPGFPNNNALRSPHGDDISPPSLWRSTMMANAFRDPAWRAKVSAEIAAHPQYQQIIEDKCSTCHAPLGRTEAIYHGAQYYALAEAIADPLARDGVSCTLCHQINADNLGTAESFSGHYRIENVHLIYGPYQNPVGAPMQMMSGYTPVFGEQVHESELCATCHTLFTPTVDNNGDIVGEAPEQTPYLEWKNSKFPAENVQCQTCHMPEIDDPVVISNRPASLAGRSPFAKHYFVGANVFMQRILKKYGAELGVTASESHFDSTIARTLRILQHETAELSGDYFWKSADSLIIKVAVKNKSGHKFPTAYPSRRAWLHFNLKDNGGGTVFESGAWNPASGEIIALDADYETHYDVITEPDQVQLYQAIMKDVDGKVNYTLLRAAGFIKDNRIPPEGFTATGPHYDSTAVEGLAIQDPNFNRHDGSEGSGTDTVTYKISGLGSAQSYQLEVKLLYQTFPPRFIADLFQYSTPEVEKFKGYYQNVSNSPVTIDSLALSIGATGIDTKAPLLPVSPVLVQAYPNPFNPATTIQVATSMPGVMDIFIYNLTGKRIRSLVRNSQVHGMTRFTWDAKDDGGNAIATGQYFVEVVFKNLQTAERSRQLRKIVYLK